MTQMKCCLIVFKLSNVYRKKLVRGNVQRFESLGDVLFSSAHGAFQGVVGATKFSYLFRRDVRRHRPRIRRSPFLRCPRNLRRLHVTVLQSQHLLLSELNAAAATMTGERASKKQRRGHRSINDAAIAKRSSVA